MFKQDSWRLGPLGPAAQENDSSNPLSPRFSRKRCFDISFASIGVAHDQLPIALGLTAQARNP